MNASDLLAQADKALRRDDLDRCLSLLTEALDGMLEEWPDIADWSPSYVRARALQVELAELIADPLGAVRD